MVMARFPGCLGLFAGWPVHSLFSEQPVAWIRANYVNGIAQSGLFKGGILHCIACPSQAHSLQATSLHKDCHSAGEPYGCGPTILLFLYKLWLEDFGF